MLQALIYRKGTIQAETNPQRIAEAFGDPQVRLWIRLQAASQAENTAILTELGHFHPLTIEDTLSTGYQAPKVDDFDTYLFVIIHAVVCEQDNTVSTTEINCFLGQNYLITACHEATLKPLDSAWERARRDERTFDRGLDFLLHGVLDTIVDEYLPVLDQIDDRVDALEDRIIMRPNSDDLRTILELKHMILALRRITSPQREVMLRLSRGDFAQIQQQYLIYFRDIYDHLVRITDLSESVRDVVSGTLDIYLSVSSNKLNEVMKALTIVSTIFLPLTLVTSLYGMNFEFMPELHWHYGYAVVWAVMITIIGGMLWFFRRRRWL